MTCQKHQKHISHRNGIIKCKEKKIRNNQTFIFFLSKVNLLFFTVHRALCVLEKERGQTRVQQATHRRPTCGRQMAALRVQRLIQTRAS